MAQGEDRRASLCFGDEGARVRGCRFSAGFCDLEVAL